MVDLSESDEDGAIEKLGNKNFNMIRQHSFHFILKVLVELSVSHPFPIFADHINFKMRDVVAGRQRGPWPIFQNLMDFWKNNRKFSI